MHVKKFCIKTIIKTDLNLKKKIDKTVLKSLDCIEEDLRWWKRRAKIENTVEAQNRIFFLLKEKYHLQQELNNLYGHKT